MWRFLRTLLILVLFLGADVCVGVVEATGSRRGRERTRINKKDKPVQKPIAQNPSESTIWDVLKSDPDFGRFYKHLGVYPGPEKILNDPARHVTVFAPTNEAINNRGAISDMARLYTMVHYHIVDGIVSAEDVESGAVTELKTMLVNDVSVYTKLPKDSSQVMVVSEGKLSSGVAPDAKIVGKRVQCKNGVIYQIPVFMIPPYESVDVAKGSPFSKMLPFLMNEISTKQGLTVFVPSSKAFKTAASHASALKVTRRHVLAGALVYEGDFKHGLKLQAMDGTMLQITVKDGIKAVNGKPIVKTNIPTNFGVIHLIDGGIPTLRDQDIVSSAEVSVGPDSDEDNRGLRSRKNGRARANKSADEKKAQEGTAKETKEPEKKADGKAKAGKASKDESNARTNRNSLVLLAIALAPLFLIL